MQSCSIAKHAEMSKSFSAKNKKTCKKSKKGVDNSHSFCYNIQATSGERKAVPQRNGGIAQLARAFGSYPTGRWFKSDFRYQLLLQQITSFLRRARPVGQAVKTRPFHGCNMGSIPVRVTKNKEHGYATD